MITELRWVQGASGMVLEACDGHTWFRVLLEGMVPSFDLRGCTPPKWHMKSVHGQDGEAEDAGR
jgi:hypothetical protein